MGMRSSSFRQTAGPRIAIVPSMPAIFMLTFALSQSRRTLAFFAMAP
jgi:hypothetical protein